MYFDKQEFMVMHKCLAYYAGIILNAFRHLLCSLLRQHNRRVPNHWRAGIKGSGIYLGNLFMFCGNHKDKQ